MSRKLLNFLVILNIFHLSIQNVNDNKVDDENAYANVASEILKDKNMENIGGMIGDFMQSDGGKQLGDMLMSGIVNSNEVSQQILQGLGSVFNQKEGGGGALGGLDPSMIGNILSTFASSNNENGKDSGFDVMSLLSGLQGGDGGGGDGIGNLLNVAPMLLQTMNSFFGDDAKEREKAHAGHAWMLPPIIERIHVLIDHFLHSDMGRTLITNLGAENFVKIFRDETGRLSYRKFVDMLENHSFRRHWIHMITSRILDFFAYFADPYTQRKFVGTIQFFVNNFLKSQGVPKSGLLDPARPTESINSLINHISKKLFNTKYDFKPYIKPVITYIQELMKLAEQKGIIGRAINSQALSHKLTDTINLEIIEPIARVNRAYRFAKNVPECDRYVMCLINEQNPDEKMSIPGLKKMLYKGASIFASWFLSSHTGTSFLTLYNVITDENNCQSRFVDACNDFHIEEIKVTTEYVHNEL